MSFTMPSPKSPWAQIALDFTDLEQGCKIAKTAVKAGADLVEAGTPLIYFSSVKGIGEIVKNSKPTPVLADFKAQDGVYKYFIEASKQGAKFAVVLGVCNDGSVKEALRAKNECDIKVVADLFSVKVNELATRASELEKLGVDMVMLHFGIDQSKYEEKDRSPLLGLDKILEVVSIPVSVATFNLEQSVEAVKMGASCIVQGTPIINAENPYDEIKKFVDHVHSAV